MPFEGHNGCCGVENGDHRIEELKKNLNKDDIQNSNRFGDCN